MEHPVPWSITVDCRNAGAQARFWALALGYQPAPPPAGWDSWRDWLIDNGVPEREWDDGAAIQDPDGLAPQISFLRVPEPKTVKNRLHLDLKVSGGRHLAAAVRTGRIEAKVAQLVAAGATVCSRCDGPDGELDHVVMKDPEEAEFCVV